MPTKTIPISQDGAFTTVTVTGGTFLMGSTTGNSYEQPVHSVTLTTYSIGKYEVTNKEFADFLNVYGQSNVKSGVYEGQTMIYENSTGGLVKSGNTWAPATGKGNYPIINVTWYGAYEFCNQYGGRLPTEAEWEFAARGGNSSKNYTYSGSNTIDDVAWHIGNSTNVDCILYNGKGTHYKGTKTANELGIYDMSGNVMEWCNDWYNEYLFYSQTNPKGALSGTLRVLRGGS